MKLGPIPESLLEAAALAAGAVPRPVLDTLVAAGLARTLMAAGKAGVFEALAEGPCDADTLARRCGTHPDATRKLLVALHGCGYVERDGAAFAATALTRRWLSPDARKSLLPFLVLMDQTWEWLGHYDHYLRTGESCDVHAHMTEQQWGEYQRGMRALSSLSVDEFVRRTPVPARARDMIDIGGAHGLYSAGLCRRLPELRAVVLDLPDAVRHAQTLVAREGLGDRLELRAGDARTEDLGLAAWDFVLVSNLAHHFDEAENSALCRRIARALRPGGVLVIQETIGPDDGNTAGQAGALGAFYFATLSASATWSFADIARWQREAGLVPKRPMRLMTAPTLGQQAAVKR